MNPNDGTSLQDETSGRPSFLDELLEVSSPVVPAQKGEIPVPPIPAIPSAPVVESHSSSVSADSFFSFIDPTILNTGTNTTPSSPVPVPVPVPGEGVQAVSVSPILASPVPNNQTVTGQSPVVATTLSSQVSTSTSTSTSNPNPTPNPNPTSNPPLNSTELLPGLTASTVPLQSPSGAPKPPKNPITKAQIMRIIGALFFVALVFFGSFLAYIVFNPEKASFFISFGINPADIASLLVKLVNTIFGSLTIGLSGVFMYFLFRSYLAKGAPKKRAIYIILSVLSGITLFSNIGFWAFLFREIGASDFVRPSGGIIVYDNDLLLSDTFKNNAELGTEQLAGLIGPVTLRYDLSSDARFVSKDIEIESFEVDCNGDGSIEHEGVSPNDDSIICTYDRRGSYQPRGTYIGRNTVTRDPEKKKMEFNIVKVAGVVDIKSTDNSVIFDATDLKNIGKLSWYTGADFQTKASSDLKFSAKISDTNQFVCLAIEKNKEDVCKRVFSVASKTDSPIVGIIKYEADIDNPMKFTFRVVDARSKSGAEIESYNWFLNDTDKFGKGETVEKTLSSYGTYKVSVELVDTTKNKVTLTEKIVLQKPLQLSKGNEGDGSQLRIEDAAGNSLIERAYDRDLQAFKISGFSVPTKMIFDASDIRVQNSGYELKEVEWKFNKDVKKGLRVEYEFIGETRYNVDISYVFARTGGKEADVTIKEKVIIEGKTPEITPKLDISPVGQGDVDNLFAPVSVSFDASASKAKSGSISQFIFDFGEGKEPSEGEAIKTYLYSIPGEYTVILTVVKDDGTKEKLSRKLIIKNAPRKLIIGSSMSSGFVNKPVEFSTEGSIGQIATYDWDFGDGEKSTDSNPNHTFVTPGKYTVELKALYDDGVIRSEKIDFEVGE